MLVQFAVRNFRSFRERAVLDLTGPSGSLREPLAMAALLGANASGKSNLVAAWAALCSLATYGTAVDQPLPFQPFKLDPACRAEPMALSAWFWADGRLWSYHVEISERRVELEALTLVSPDSGEDEAVVFRRAAEAGPVPRVEWGDGLERVGIGRREAGEERRRFLSFVAQGTRAEQPLLAELRARNAYELQSVVEYFNLSYTTRILDPGHDMGGVDPRFIQKMLLMWPNVRAEVAGFLRSADTGVQRISVEVTRPDIEALIDQGAPVPEPLAEEYLGAGGAVRLRFHHAGGALDLGDLSAGTRRLIGLSFPWSWFGIGRPQTLLLDELDRSLHPALTRHLLHWFHTHHQPHSQLVFTTHDSRLLDSELLDPHAIWFVEKDARGGSTLYSLAEFKPDQLERLRGELDGGYRLGRFGAVPRLAKVAGS